MTETRWPAEATELWPIATLVPHATNARLHGPEQVEKIARSIEHFGFVNPVLIDVAGGIIAGHGRVLAAAQLGMTEVPCLKVGWLTEEQKRAYVLADNRLAELSGWDFTLVGSEIAALKDWGFDTSLLGFDETGFPADGIGGGGAGLGSLSDRFGVPPFTVLNAREGWWQSRKAAWIGLGIKSELGRGENLLQFSDSVRLDGEAYKERFVQRPKKGTLGATPPNEKEILNAKTGPYANKRKRRHG